MVGGSEEEKNVGVGFPMEWDEERSGRAGGLLYCHETSSLQLRGRALGPMLNSPNHPPRVMHANSCRDALGCIGDSVSPTTNYQQLDRSPLTKTYVHSPVMAPPFISVIAEIVAESPTVSKIARLIIFGNCRCSFGLGHGGSSTSPN